MERKNVENNAWKLNYCNGEILKFKATEKYHWHDNLD